MKTTSIVCIALSTFFAVQAHADESAHQAKLNKKLQGSYAGIENFSCVISPNGFGPAPQYAAVGPTSRRTGTSSFVTTFDGNGNLSAVVKASSMIVKSTADAGETNFPHSTSDVTCTGTYQVNADKTATERLTCSGALTTGIIPGLNFTISEITTTGRMLGKVFLATNDTGVEASTTVYGTELAMCSRSYVSKKMSDDDTEE